MSSPILFIWTSISLVCAFWLGAYYMQDIGTKNTPTVHIRTSGKNVYIESSSTGVQVYLDGKAYTGTSM